MLRFLFLFLAVVHGLIHLLGFVKAFNISPVQQLTAAIPKVNGVLWLLAAILFLIGAVFFFTGLRSWWVVFLVAVILSQYLIFTCWTDAKFGTIANLTILLAVITGFAAWSFYSSYLQDVKTAKKNSEVSVSMLTENDIGVLPPVVQQYVRYTGSLNKPKVINCRIRFCGRIRKDEKSGWMHFASEQNNFFASAKRFFFMNATMKQMPVAGYHCFENGKASMDIRLFSLFRVQYQHGPEMDTAETVTMLNDMCCMAPATLIDKRITWEQADSHKAKAIFSNNGITVSAWLYFNEKGELVNFISDNRYADMGDGTMKKIRWSTPMGKYEEMNGYRLSSFAQTIYAYPQGDFCYGEFETKAVEYNYLK